MTTLHRAVHVEGGKWKVFDKRVNIPCFMFGSRADLVVRLERAAHVEAQTLKGWRARMMRASDHAHSTQRMNGRTSHIGKRVETERQADETEEE